MAQGGTGGLVARGEGSSYLYLMNFTVVDNGGQGIRAESDRSKVFVLNSIAFGHDEDLVLTGEARVRSSLVGVDPRFVNRAGGDYRLRAGSPARDSGWTPPASTLGPRDAYQQPRLVGSSIDIGAAEFQP